MSEATCRVASQRRHGTRAWPCIGTAAVLLLAAVGGCGVGDGTRSATSPATGPAPLASFTPATGAPPTTVISSAPATPTSAGDAVQRYFAAIAAHDATAARRYLSPEFAHAFGTSTGFDAWVANYKSLSNLDVRGPQTAAADTASQHPDYQDFVLYSVSYQVVLKQPSANEVSGRLDRFVLLGRASSSSEWLILDVATSP